jgi:NAD(P)-dependent dehydrogenase (short-subunit alcohol dehydrogenase family)
MADRRVAVVTGGASGIGEATARRLAADGYAIAVLDVNVQGGERVAKAIAEGGGQARFVSCDVAEEKSVNAAAKQVETELGPATVLVTSAGLIPNTESVMDMDLEAHARMWRVNYDGTIHAARAFGRQMIAAGRGGAMVTLGSINSRLPLPLPGYNPGKAAVERLTQLLAVELGRHGIRVNSVGPTYVMTPPLKATVDAGQRDLNNIMAVHALDRLPKPEDIANAIAFLCSDQAATITGILLPVDAGWLAAVSYRTYAGGVPWTE